jgi:actin-related protein 9
VPGSETTLAQLGLPETFTPPKWKFPTRMFPGDKEGEYTPMKIVQVTKTTENAPVSSNGGGDYEMTDVAPEATTLETSYVDDPLDTSDAVYPMIAGSIVNYPCLFALFSHIFQTLSPPFHVPVLLVAQPVWTHQDRERITQFFFESFKIPAFAMIDSATAALYSYAKDHACVVDVGQDKCDVTAINDFCIQDTGRAIAVKGCGGRDMTKRLYADLKDKDFTMDMCEQLKKNPICEVLPVGVPMPTSKQAPAAAQPSNPAALASTGAMDSGVDAKDADGMRPGQGPRGPGIGTDVGEEGEDGENLDLEEKEAGVLDIASIIAKDNAAEILAKREREKAERAAARKSAADAARQVRLKNSEKVKASFSYVEFVPMETNQNGAPPSRKRKREVEVGIERFMCAEPPKGQLSGVIDDIAAAIHRTIMAVPEVGKRSDLWDNMIIIGKGGQVRGFKDALLSVLHTRYVVSPSSATMFTSELPSNLSTPLPTNGTNTPVPGQMQSQQLHHTNTHGVNPLLAAATKHATQQLHPAPSHLQVPGSHHEHTHHRGHSQGPTSIKVSRVPEYFSEWKDQYAAPMEEAAFIGAQTAAKCIFIVDQGATQCFLTRGAFNEVGPVGIHDIFL